MNFQFVIEFMKQPKKIGAIAPSSGYLARMMTPEHLFPDAEIIVELGAGMGQFTKEIVRKKNDKSRVIVFETNPLFFDELVEEYAGHENVLILMESAEKLPVILEALKIEQVDLIVSGLPFSSFEMQKTKKILSGIHSALGNKGIFLTFQYSKYRKNIFEQLFEHVTYKREFRNLPPAYVFECRKLK